MSPACIPHPSRCRLSFAQLHKNQVWKCNAWLLSSGGLTDVKGPGGNGLIGVLHCERSACRLVLCLEPTQGEPLARVRSTEPRSFRPEAGESLSPRLPAPPLRVPRRQLIFSFFSLARSIQKASGRLAPDSERRAARAPGSDRLQPALELRAPSSLPEDTAARGGTWS